MKFNEICFLLLLSTLIVCGCDFHSDIGEGLSHDQYIKSAEQYVSKGDVNKAISAYKKALKIKPDDPKAHFALGKIYITEWRKSYDSAYNKYQLDTFKNVKRSMNLIEDLEKYGLKNEYKDMALHELYETLKYEPNNWAAREYIATDHLNSQRYNEAIEEYKILIEIDPKVSIVYWHIADAYTRIGSFDLAIENLAKAFHLDSDTEYYYYRTGQVYVKMNNNEKAFEMLSKLKKMNSSYYDKLFTDIYSSK